jgi:hypothetical protein
MAGTVREEIAAKIKADNASYSVHAFPVSPPENLAANKVFVSVYRESMTNAPQLAAVTQSLKLQVITAKTGTAIAENELEDALFEVLVSIASLNYVKWTTAERAIFAEKFIGYEVALEANTENIYKPSAS